MPGGRVFKDNRHAGRFISDILEPFKQLSSLDKPSFFVNSSKNARVPICDEAVYSRNRNFRLYLSSKAKRETTLQLAQDCQFYDKLGSVSKILKRLKN